MKIIQVTREVGDQFQLTIVLRTSARDMTADVMELERKARRAMEEFADIEVQIKKPGALR